jgi:arginine/lysine/histidine transporter system substrate-binding protein
MNWSTVTKLLLILGTIYGMNLLVRNRRTGSRIDRETLIVGTNSEYPPYSFIDNNSIVGFDIDIITEIAHRLGKKIDIQDMAFTTLLPQLTNGRVHVIAAGMTKNEERAQHVLFTKPYLDKDPLVAITKPNKPAIKTIDDLLNKQIVVNEGFTADTFVSKLRGPVVTRLTTVTDALLALNADRADVFVTARSALKKLLDEKKSDYVVWEIPQTSEEYVFVVSKLHPKLLENIQKILDEMQEDGTLETIKRKWNLA